MWLSLLAEEANNISNTATGGAAWVAVVLAVGNGILLTFQMMNGRKRDEFKDTLQAQMEKDKAEREVQRERDIRNYDTTLIELKNKLIELEKDHKRCEEERIRDRTFLKEEITIRDKRYDDIIKLILKREEDIDEWRALQDKKVTKIESEIGVTKPPTVPLP